MTSFRGSGFTAVTGSMALGQVRAAWPVGAQPLKATASTVNWLLGRGTPLVVDGGYEWPETATEGVEHVLNYYYQVDSIHDTLGMLLTMTSSRGVKSVYINGAWETIGPSPTLVYRAFANFGGDTEGSLALSFQWVGGPIGNSGRITVHNVSLYECPAVFIEESGAENIEPNDLIYDGSADRRSISGIERAVEDLRTTYFRRGALYNWTSGGYAHTTTSPSFVELHPLGVKPAIQTRLMYAENSRKVMCNVYARVTGPMGQIRITMSSGDYVDFFVSSTSDTWHTTQEIYVTTDDPFRWDTDGGLRGGVRDEVDIQYKVGGGNTLYLLGVSIWDAPGD